MEKGVASWRYFKRRDFIKEGERHAPHQARRVWEDTEWHTPGYFKGTAKMNAFL